MDNQKRNKKRKSASEHDAKKFNDSIVSGLRSIELKKDFVPSYASVADSYFRLGDLTNAKKYALSGLELDSSQIELNRILGFVLFEQKNYSAAVDAFSKTSSLQPNNPEHWANKGLALLNLKDYDLALTSFLVAEEKGDRVPNTFLYMTYIYLQMGRLPKVIEYSEKYREYSHNSTASLCLLQTLYADTGDVVNSTLLKKTYPNLSCQFS